jgi:hypothetical protein
MSRNPLRSFRATVVLRPPDHMAVITAKTGKPLPPGQLLAQPGQQGIQEQA